MAEVSLFSWRTVPDNMLTEAAACQIPQLEVDEVAGFAGEFADER